MNSSHPPRPSPPVAKKEEKKLESFGDLRVDNYYWLGDDLHSNPQVLSYLQLENEYTESIMSETKPFEEELFCEMKARNREDGISLPVRQGSYYYYERNFEGKECVLYCRRFIRNNEAPRSLSDTMPTGPDDPPEHVIIDEEVMAKNQNDLKYRISTFKVSPNNKFVAYDQEYEKGLVHVIDIESRAPVGKPLELGNFEWAGNEALVYLTVSISVDATIWPNKVWLHKLGEERSSDSCIYDETDDLSSLTLEASGSKQFLFVKSKSKDLVCVFYLDVSRPEVLTILSHCEGFMDIFVSHRGNHFFIRRSDGEISACPVDNTSETMVLVPYRESVRVDDMKLFADHILVSEQSEDQHKLTAYRLPAVGEPLKPLQDGRDVEFYGSGELCRNTVVTKESQFFSSILRFSVYALRIPWTIIDYDMNTGISVLKYEGTILGAFDMSNYVTERKWACASDDINIPMSIVYRKNLVKLDGSNPLLLYGYGSYGSCTYPNSFTSRLSILDRGIIFAIAHVRGGGDLGELWHENGKLLNKKNTFMDFIACAEYLVESKYCSKGNLCIEGSSAGGLLIGAVLNMRPDLFKVAVADVPFVDVLTTMQISPKPLDLQEWGDPWQEQFYFYIKSYSPVDNVKAQNYPNILVRTGSEDTVVEYSEPAKFVAKLRDMKTDDNLLLLKCAFGAGHSLQQGRLGRLQQLQSDSFKYTFILKALNMIPASAAENS